MKQTHLSILYWNLHRRDLRKPLAALASENQLDVIIVSEFYKFDLDYFTRETLDGEWRYVDGYGGCEKVRLLYRNAYVKLAEILSEGTRYTIYMIHTSDGVLLITGLHLQDRRNSTTEDREITIRDIKVALFEFEEMYGRNSVIIGDFNAGPFDREIIYTTNLFATPYDDIAREIGTKIRHTHTYRPYFNPIPSRIFENKYPHGSFFYEKELNSQYWYSYDQVIVRPEMIDKLLELKYIDRCSKYKFVKPDSKYNRPNDGQYSDHFPLLVRLSI